MQGNNEARNLKKKILFGGGTYLKKFKNNAARHLTRVHTVGISILYCQGFLWPLIL
jgi:hypothetical protein